MIDIWFSRLPYPWADHPIPKWNGVVGPPPFYIVILYEYSIKNCDIIITYATIKQLHSRWIAVSIWHLKEEITIFESGPWWRWFWWPSWSTFLVVFGSIIGTSSISSLWWWYIGTIHNNQQACQPSNPHCCAMFGWRENNFRKWAMVEVVLVIHLVYFFGCIRFDYRYVVNIVAMMMIYCQFLKVAHGESGFWWPTWYTFWLCLFQLLLFLLANYYTI